MKLSLLLVTLALGVTIGVFLDPVKRLVNEYAGRLDTFGQKNIPHPSDPEINAAFARHLDGHTEEARSRLNTVLSANPANAEALYYMGRIDLDQKKYEDAANRLSQAAKLDDKLPNVWAFVASAFLGLGQSRNAMDALRNISAQPSTTPASAAPSPVGSKVSPTPAG
jgi:predicted Zn-dependent protease